MRDPQRDHLASTALKIRYPYASTEEFIRQSSADISLLGIFIKTKNPWKEGGPFKLELQQQDGNPVVRGIGQVVWSREIAESEDKPSGMGIKFLKLDEASREVIERAVAARGSAPSRFDTLGEAESEIERRFPRLINTLIGIQAVGVFGSSKPLSLSPDADAPTNASSPVDADPHRYAFTREKPWSIPSQVRPEEAELMPAAEAPVTAERDIRLDAELPLWSFNPASLAPPATTFTQSIPQGDAEFIQSQRPSVSVIVARDVNGEPMPASEQVNGTMLRERLVKQAASKPPPAWSDNKSVQRLERLAELSKAEIQEYTDPLDEQKAREIAEMEKRASEATLHAFPRLGMFGPVAARAEAALRIGIVLLRTTMMRRRREAAISALLVLLLFGGIGALSVLAPKWRQAAQVQHDTPSQASVTAEAELHRNAEEMELVEALHTGSEPEPAERSLPKRYLLRVVTQPDGAMVTVDNKRFVTPGEVELDKPEGALRVNVRKKLHHSIQRHIAATEFHPEGDVLAHTLQVRLKKQSSKTLRGKPFETDSKSDVPTFHVEPLTELPKLSIDSF